MQRERIHDLKSSDREKEKSNPNQEWREWKGEEEGLHIARAQAKCLFFWMGGLGQCCALSRSLFPSTTTMVSPCTPQRVSREAALWRPSDLWKTEEENDYFLLLSLSLSLFKTFFLNYLWSISLLELPLCISLSLSLLPIILISPVELASCKLWIVFAVDSFVSKLLSDFVHSINSTND